MLGRLNRRLVFLGLLLVLAAVIIACGEEATSTSQPAPAAPEATAAPAAAATTAATAAPAVPSAPTPAATPTPAAAAPTETAMEGPSGPPQSGHGRGGPRIACAPPSDL